METRRTFLHRSALGAAAAWSLFETPGLFAETLVRTPGLTEGPFYPDKLPLDTDNDLVIVNNKITPAIGEITHLTGTVRDVKGNPIRNAFVEIWQCDAKQRYLHTASADEQSDANFQGYGRFLTGTSGEYYFRTIKPVAYPGRTPHIHVAISTNGRRLATTQLLINGDPQNERDGVFAQVRDPALRELLLVDFEPIKESKIGELSAKFDVVVGVTPEEDEDGKLKGGIAPSAIQNRGGAGFPGGPGRGPGGPGRGPRPGGRGPGPGPGGRGPGPGGRPQGPPPPRPE